MKLGGKKIEGPNVSIIVIPRDSGDLVFKAQAILDYTGFEAICPEPQPPEILKPGYESSKDPEDPKYLEDVMTWAKKKTNWMLLKSLEATEDLEWETVDMSKPETWDNYRKEMHDAGFTPIEIARIMGTVMDANGLNQDRIDEATKRFLAIPEAESKG